MSWLELLLQPRLQREGDAWTGAETHPQPVDTVSKETVMAAEPPEMLMLVLLRHNLAKANKYSGSTHSSSFIQNILAIYIRSLKIS